MVPWVDLIFVIFERVSKFDICIDFNVFFRFFPSSKSFRTGNGSHPKHHELSPIASINDGFSSAGARENSYITRIERTPSAPSNEVFKHFFLFFLRLKDYWGKIWLPDLHRRANFSSSHLRTCFLCIMLLEVHGPGNDGINLKTRKSYWSFRCQLIRNLHHL